MSNDKYTVTAYVTKTDGRFGGALEFSFPYGAIVNGMNPYGLFNKGAAYRSAGRVIARNISHCGAQDFKVVSPETVTGTLDTFNSPAVQRPLTGTEMMRLTREVMNALK